MKLLGLLELRYDCKKKKKKERVNRFVIKAVSWGAKTCISIPTSLQSYLRQVGDVSLSQLNQLLLWRW